MDRLYPLAPSVWGVGEEIQLEHIVQAPLFGEFPSLGGTAYFDVLLHPNPLTGAWRVRRLLPGSEQGRVLGDVPESQRERFESMRRVEASLMMPVTTCELRLDPDTGLFAASIILPAPQLAVPRNDPPAQALVLPPGDMLVVDTAVGEFSAEELEGRSPGTWFVRLHEIGGTVVAMLGDKVLGGFDDRDAATLLDYLDKVRAVRGAGSTAREGAGEAAGEGTALFARAVLLNAMVALNAGSPREGLQRVPALKVPDSAPTAAWAFTEFPDGSWAVTVERPFATDPADAPRPRHTARYVSLTGRERPADVAAPTEMFSRVDIDEGRTEDTPEATAGAAVREAPAPVPEPVLAQPQAHPAGAPRDALAGAGDYLTEVEKVRMRRQARASRSGGRHRR